MATGGRAGLPSSPKTVTITPTIQRTDADMKFTSFQGRVRDVVFELAAMCDFEVSRRTSVPFDRPHEPVDAGTTGATQPPPEPWLWTQVQPPSLTLIPSFRAATSDADTHFNAGAVLLSGLDLFGRFVFRPAGGYGFFAAYLVGRPPFVPAPGVINCFHLRTLPLPEPSLMEERVRELFNEELQLVSRDEIGPLHSRLEVSGPLTIALQKDLPDGFGQLKHDFLEGRLSFELDVRRLRDADPRLVAIARQLVSEIESCIPTVRGRRASVDPEVVKLRFTHLLASCDALLKDDRAKTWPPVRNSSTAALLLRQFVLGSDEELLRLVPIIRSGRRRPKAGPLAIRMLARLYGLTDRQIENLIPK